MNPTNPKENNGLKLIQTLSQSRSVETFDKDTLLLNMLTETFPERTAAVVWLDDRVEIGIFHQGNFTFHATDSAFELKYVQRMRVFNQDMEFHLWRTGGNTWKGRLRQDGQGEETWDVVVANQLLFGTREKKMVSNGSKSDLFTSITEDRGTTLHLPLTGVEIDGKGTLQHRIFITSYNYIYHNALQQAGYVDCRFVKFCTFKDDAFIGLGLAGH